MRRSIAVAALVAALLCLGALSPLGAWLEHLLRAARGAGPLGALLYAAAFVPAALLLLPSAPLAVGAGHAFGPVQGTLVATVGTALGATAAFQAGRRLGGDGVRRMLARSRRLAPFTRVLERAGFEVVLWLRLSPLVPFSLLNYAFGATGLRACDYAAATALGLLPGCAMYALLGSVLSSLRPGAVEAAPRLGAAAAALGLSALAAISGRIRLPRLLSRPEPGLALPGGPVQARAPSE